MSSIDVPLRGSRFGHTSRRDLVVGCSRCSHFWGSLSSSSTRLGRHFKATTIASAPICRRFILPSFWADPLHAWFGAWPAGGPHWAPMSAALLILWAPGGFRSLATTIAAPITKRSGLILLPVRSASREKAIGASALSLSSCKTFIAISSIWRLSFWLFWLSTSGGRSGFIECRAPERVEFGVGIGTLVLAVNVVLLAMLYLRLPLAAAPGRRPA